MDFVTLPVVAPLVIFGSGFTLRKLVDSFAPEGEAVHTPQELDLALAKALATEAGKSELRLFFESVDTSKDGKVTAEEWAKAVSEKGGSYDTMRKFFGDVTIDELRAQFSRLDVDGSNDLTWDEFSSGVTSLGAAIKIANSIVTDDTGSVELKQLFRKLDKDGDGRVTYPEWGTGVFKDQRILRRFFGSLTSTSTPERTVALKAPMEAAIAAAKVAKEQASSSEAALAAKTRESEAAGSAASRAAAMAKTKKDSVQMLTQDAAKAASAISDAQAAVADAESKVVAAPAATPSKKKKTPKKGADAAATAAAEAAAQSAQRVKDTKATLEAAKAAADKATKAVEAAKAEVSTAEAEKASTEAAQTTAQEAVRAAKAQAQEDATAAEQTQADEKAAVAAYDASVAADRVVVAEIGKTFKRLDIDSNGALSWDECATRRLPHDHGPPPSPARDRLAHRRPVSPRSRRFKAGAVAYTTIAAAKGADATTPAKV